jgi:hypothetical protein
VPGGAAARLLGALLLHPAPSPADGPLLLVVLLLLVMAPG